MRRLLIATANPGKVREFREMLGAGHVTYRGEPMEWTDLSHFRDLQPVEETGETFLDNAKLKASLYARHASRYATQAQCWALADDSGLEVDALNGAPGVHSARWAQMNGAGAGDAANNALLLRHLQDVPEDKRTGRFVCVLALADPSGEIILTARDAVEGRILRSPRGTGGFGYDPLFYIESLGRTTAELSPDQKHAVSHRGKALRRMRDLMARAGFEGANA